MRSLLIDLMHKGGNISDMGTPPLGARLFRELVGRCIVIPSKRMFVLKIPTKGPLKNGIFHKTQKTIGEDVEGERFTCFGL